MPSETNLMRELLRESIALNRADKYGQFEHAAVARSAAGKIPANASAELRFRIAVGSAPAVATDFTSESSLTPPGTTSAIAAVKFSDGPGPDGEMTDEDRAAGFVARPGASGYSAATTDPVGVGPFDLAEDTDLSSGRFYYGAIATFEMRTIDLRDYLVVTLSNECLEHSFSISEFYFNGPEDVGFELAVCVVGSESEQWDYYPSVL